MNVLLGIETSCDETSAAILKKTSNGPKLASLVILSQDIHNIFGGVVPELASRAHVEALGPVVERTLLEAGVSMDEVDAVAATAGPGLAGALLVGLCYAKSLAAAGNRRFIGVHHLEGHLFASILEDENIEPPFVGLIVSGGHTLLIDVPQWGRYKKLGETRDDAAGEAFDKVAKLLELGYPGGPAIERLAGQGQDNFDFPRPLIREGFDFSFSGLKTAVLYAARDLENVDQRKADLSRSFQQAVFDVLIAKVKRALTHTGYTNVVLGGGVACSKTLASQMREALDGKAHLSVASPRLNADNAAMIARAGWFHLENGRDSLLDCDADPRMPFPGLEQPEPQLT